MKYDRVAKNITNAHTLIQTKPEDRLDYIQKTAEIKQVIIGCVNYLDQLHGDPNIMDYSEKDLSAIHEAVCVSAIPLLNMIERFLEAAKAEAAGYSFAV